MTASAKEVIAKTAGDYYDGYADPADTPENWSRGLGCANDILAALDAAGYVVVQRGAHDALVAALERAANEGQKGQLSLHTLMACGDALAMARKP